METTFYIVRHGQSEGNINGDITGSDPSLTEKGFEQAQMLANLMDSIAVDRIISSNLIRAKQTAEIIALKKNLAVIEVPHIRERFFGELEGLKGDEVSAKYQHEWDRFHTLSLEEQMKWKLVDGMESLGEVLDRTLTFFNSLVGINKQETILVVTHANVMLALLAHFSFVRSLSQLPYGSIKNTAYIKLESKGDTYQIADVFGITKKT